MTMGNLAGRLLIILSLPLLLLPLTLFAFRPPRQAGAGSVIISELAWNGTAVSDVDEWLELHNTTDAPIDLSGWTLSDGGDLNLALTGAIVPSGFYLIEQGDDN